MTGSPGSRRWTWTAATVCGAALIVLGAHLLSLAQSSSRQRQWAQDQILIRGRILRQGLESSGYQPPPGPIAPSATADPAEMIAPLRGLSLKLDNRSLWAVPQGFDAPRADRPPPLSEAVERIGTDWLYTYGLPDGRTFLASFALPAFARESRRTTVLLLTDASFLIALLLTAGLLGWRAYRQTAERAPGSEFQETGASPQAMVDLFQQTVKELRKRTSELEEAHQRERTRAEDGERMAEALCANLEAGYLRFGEDGRLSGVNAAARALLGLQEVPRLGDPDQTLLREREGVARVLEEVHSANALVLREEVQGAPGVLLEVVGIPLFNLLHQRKGYLLILKDQTAVYAMRRTLREREALSRLGEVSAGVVHEVRNALNTISARLRLMGQDMPELADNPSFRAVAEESQNLEQVMQALLFFARPLPQEREMVDLEELLEEERSALSLRQGGASVAVEAASVRVPADREALARAVRNLARNAAESVAGAPAGRRQIRLSALAEGAMALVRVEDSGPGVNPEALPNIFTPFFSQKPGGTGLGLAIARKVAREHGGDLIYFASALGGAGFELSLPLAFREPIEGK